MPQCIAVQVGKIEEILSYNLRSGYFSSKHLITSLTKFKTHVHVMFLSICCFNDGIVLVVTTADMFTTMQTSILPGVSGI